MGFDLPVILGDALVLESNPRFAHAATMRPSAVAAYRFNSNAADRVNQASALSVQTNAERARKRRRRLRNWAECRRCRGTVALVF